MLELKIKEPRINFCLNYGVKSGSNLITIFYDPLKLDENLNIASSNFLQQCLKIDIYRGTVSLPKVCSWYARDFIPKGEEITNKTICHKVMKFAGTKQYKQFHLLLIHKEIDIIYKIR